ncbi:MAG: amidohydrolase family protein [Acidimicrobiia bacterium]
MSTTRIIADTLIPGRGDPVDGGTVVIEAGMIVYAGPTAEAPAGAEDEAVVEVPAVLPGMWDCHAHYVGITTPNIEALALTNPVTAAARSTADLARVLDAGVTSVREVGGLGIHLARAVDEGVIQGPNIYAAGAILSTTGGHGDIHALPLDWIHQAGDRGLGILCDGVPEVLKAVRRNLRNNARVIKVCASGGVMSEVDSPIHQQFSGEELSAIVAEAARADRIVAAHCHGKPGIMAALRAGVRTIEHGSFLDEEAAELMVEKGAILVPTRFVIDELLFQVDRLPRYAYEKGQAIADRHEMAMKVAVATGVRIAAGCDIFVSGEMHGENSREIDNLINAGLSDLDAIETATATPPETLGSQAPHTGQLRTGFDADVVALDTNPLDDRTVWGDSARVTHVWKGGRLQKAPA